MTYRLLMVCQPTDGGAATCVADLTRAAVKDGVIVTVACPDGDLARSVRAVGAGWVDLPMQRALTLSELRLLPELRRLITEADVVHLHSSKAAALGRFALWTLGRNAPPSAFTPHDWSWSVGGHAAGIYRAIEWLLAPVTNVIVVVAEGEQTKGARILGHRPRHVELIQNGVDLNAFTPSGPVAPRKPEPLIVVVGRLAPQKGQDIIVRALGQMAHSTTHLRLIGEGQDETPLRSLAAQLGLTDRVEWVGVSDPRPHLRAADIVAIPSRWDAAPLVLAEAMACGTAIVCSDAVGSLNTLGQAGVTVPTNDVAGLGAALDALLADPLHLERMRKAARVQACAMPSLADSCQAHLRLWRSLWQVAAAPHGVPASGAT